MALQGPERAEGTEIEAMLTLISRPQNFPVPVYVWGWEGRGQGVDWTIILIIGSQFEGIP